MEYYVVFKKRKFYKEGKKGKVELYVTLEKNFSKFPKYIETHCFN